MSRKDQIQKEYQNIVLNVGAFFINALLMNNDLLDVMNKLRDLKKESNEIANNEKKIEDKDFDESF